MPAKPSLSSSLITIHSIDNSQKNRQKIPKDNIKQETTGLWYYRIFPNKATSRSNEPKHQETKKQQKKI